MKPGRPTEFLDVNTVALEPGINLIEASAGTGKTYSITALYLRFLLEKKLPIQQILSVTYTVAATQELRERIRTRLRRALDELRSPKSPGATGAGDPVLERYLEEGGDCEEATRLLNLAIQTFDEAPIFTIHGFCHRTLQDYAFESGVRYQAETLQSAAGLYQEIAEDFWRRHFYETSPFLAAVAVSPEAANLSPEALADLLRLSESHPGLTILPAPSLKPLETLGEQAASLFSPLLELWCNRHEEIVALALDDKCLKAGFRNPILNHALPVLEHALEQFEKPTPALITAFCAFSKARMTENLHRKKSAPEHPFFDLCERFESDLLNYLQKLPHEFLVYARGELRARKEARNLLSFDDLLARLHAALHPGGNGGPSPLAVALSAKYTVALIDEFQDTDQLQTEIFTRLFSPAREAPAHWLYYIGDPKQAIYAFRGADIFSYLNAAASATRHYSLQTNYRSCPKLLEGFNRFFLQAEAPFLFKEIAYIPVSAPPEKEAGPEPPFIFRRFLSDKELSAEKALPEVAAMLARDVLALRHGADHPARRFGEMAVLVRTGTQAALVQEHLRHHGIPSVLHSDKSVFHSEEAAALEKLLRGLVNPRNATLLRTALLTPLFAFSEAELHALQAGESVLETWTTLFTDWKAAWDRNGFIAFYRRFLSAVNLRERIVLQSGGERFLTNLGHLSELLHEEETTRQLSAEALADWLHAQRMSPASGSDETAQLRLESDNEAVTIVTIHKSKGLEYPVVFCPFLWAARDFSRNPPGCFHDEAGRITLDRRSNKEAPPEHIECYRFETRAEEMRLLYVALTRAKYLCHVYFGNARSFKDSALGHLFPEGEGELAGFASAHPGITTLVESEAPVPAAIPEETPAMETLRCREFRGTLAQPAFLTSFTSLARDHAAATTGIAERSAVQLTEPRELDEIPVEPLPEPSLPTELERDTKPGGIFLFEKGMRAGDFFHDVLEHLDFQNPDELEELLPKALSRHGFHDNPHREALDAHFRGILQTELQPGLSLSKIPKSARLTEVEFSLHLPELTAARLRQVYNGYTGPLDAQSLNFATVRGFLRGVIDLFFEHEGRYYILDWKSNWLGDTPAAYCRPQVDNAMRQHHYALQAHLYLLACDQFLQNRIQDYSYERHFGGIFYLFLRGVTPSDPALGVFFECPSTGFVRKLRTLQTSI